MFGHRNFQPVIDAIIDLAEACAKEPLDLPPVPQGLDALSERVRGTGRSRNSPKPTRRRSSDAARKVAAVKERVYGDAVGRETMDQDAGVRASGRGVQGSREGRRATAHPGRRATYRGRDTRTVRPIAVEVGLLPRAHGSALFTRGETQAFVVTTLGTGQDEQIVDALAGEFREHFMLHYNFPPYSVGEAGRFGFTGRREVGHGKLAWRAVRPLMPEQGGLPVHDQGRIGDHRVERLVLDGDRMRRVAFADGCRRATRRGRSPESPWA